MGQVSAWYDTAPGAVSTLHTSYMHNETTRVEVFSRAPDNDFRRVELGATELLRLRCGTVSIRREPADIKTRPNRMLTFIHQVRGHSAFSHYGNLIELDEGDFTLCNNSALYDLRVDGPSEVILFRVPSELIDGTLPSPEMLCGRRLPHDEGLASTAAAIAKDLANKDTSTLAPETCERAGKHLLDVLVTSYMPLIDDKDSSSAVMYRRYCKVKLFIEENLRNPELCPSFIARHLHLSDRYLRMIFEVSNESPSAYILRRRLEECAAQLRDARWRRHSITSIAFSWGFNSAPHFARSFKSKFGCSARDYRNQELMAA